jgi:hypothetical protein
MSLSLTLKQKDVNGTTMGNPFFPLSYALTHVRGTLGNKSKAMAKQMEKQREMFSMTHRDKYSSVSSKANYSVLPHMMYPSNFNKRKSI